MALRNSVSSLRFETDETLDRPLVKQKLFLTKDAYVSHAAADRHPREKRRPAKDKGILNLLKVNEFPLVQNQR